jgi:hypothetical protein
MADSAEGQPGTDRIRRAPAGGPYKALRSNRLRRLVRATWIVAALSLAGCASAPANGDATGGKDASSDASGSAADTLGADSLATGSLTADSATVAAAANVRPGIGLRQPAGELTGAPAAAPAMTSVEAPERPREIPTSLAYPGLLPTALATEPLALLPPVRITLPPEIAGGDEGRRLIEDLRRIVLDRLPAEIRIVRPRAPAYAFREWAQGRDVGPQSAYLPAILGWEGVPGPDGAIPEVVGNSVEALGDNRGIRYFLFPRSLEIFRSGRLHYVAVLEGYILDARGERAVWAGSGRAEGTLPENDTSQFLRGVVRDAAIAAVNDLVARMPGAERPIGRGGFTQ